MRPKDKSNALYFLLLQIETGNLGDHRLLTAPRARHLSKCSEQRFNSLDFWLLFINGKVTLKINNNLELNPQVIELSIPTPYLLFILQRILNYSLFILFFYPQSSNLE
jgi:hypothetical protein